MKNSLVISVVVALLVILSECVALAVQDTSKIAANLTVENGTTYKEDGNLILTESLDNYGIVVVEKTGSIQSYYVNNIGTSSIINVEGVLNAEAIDNSGKIFIQNSCINENLFLNNEEGYIEISGVLESNSNDFNNSGILKINKDGQLISGTIESTGENSAIYNNGFMKSYGWVEIDANYGNYNNGIIETYTLNIIGNGGNNVFNNVNGSIKCKSLYMESILLNGGKIYIENSSDDITDRYVLTVYNSNINIDLLSVNAKFGDILLENTNVNLVESNIDANNLILDKSSLFLGRKNQEERTHFGNTFKIIQFESDSKLITEGNIYTSKLISSGSVELISKGTVFVADSVDLQGTKITINSGLPLEEIDKKVSFTDNKGISLFNFNFLDNKINGDISTNENTVVILGDFEKGKILANSAMGDGQIVWSNAQQTSREISSLWVFPHPITISNKITLAAYSMVVIDGSEAKKSAYFGDATGKNIVVENNAKIFLYNTSTDKSGTKYILSSNSDLYNSIPKGSWGKDEGDILEEAIKTYGNVRYAYLLSNIISEDRLSFYTLEKGSTVIIKHSINVRDLYPDIIINPVIEEIKDSVGLDIDSKNPAQKFISRAMDRRYLADKDVTPVLNSVPQIGVLSYVERITTRVSESCTDVVHDHLALESAWRRESEIEAEKESFTLWASPLYGHTNMYRGGVFDRNIDFGFGGLVLGGEFESLSNKIKLGLALHLGTGYGKSSGDYLNTKNNFTFWGISGYFSWQPTEFFNIVSDTTYISVNHKLTQDLPNTLALSDIKAEVKTELLSGSLNFEYLLKNEWFNFVPYVGVRVNLLRRHNYDIYSRDGDLFHVDGNSAVFVNLPAGFRLTKDLLTSSGWTFSPMLDFKARFTLGDLYSQSTIHTLGFKEVVGVEVQSMDPILFEGKLGLEAKKGDISLRANFIYGKSQHERDYSVNLGFAWEF